MNVHRKAESLVPQLGDDQTATRSPLSPPGLPLTTPLPLNPQDRHVKKNSLDGEPVVDPSQDYFLVHGFENATHTVLRFKRKLETCDSANDMPITVSALPSPLLSQ